MTLDDLFAELALRNYRLGYLREPKPHLWEALISAPLNPPINGYLNAIGHGQSPISPFEALSTAIEAIERDPQYPEPFQPAENESDMIAADNDLMSILFPSNKPAIFPRRKL